MITIDKYVSISQTYYKNKQKSKHETNHRITYGIESEILQRSIYLSRIHLTIQSMSTDDSTSKQSFFSEPRIASSEKMQFIENIS